MPVNAIDSQGTALVVDGVTVAGTKSISGLGSGSPSERDRSTLEDRNFRRFGVGLRDGGSVNVAILVDTGDAGQRKAYAYWRRATRCTIQVQFVNGVTLTFAGYITGFAIDAGADADLTASLTIRVDGDVPGFPDPS